MLPRREPTDLTLLLGMAAATGLALGAADAIVDLSVRSNVSASPLSTWTCLGLSALAGALTFVLLALASLPLARRAPDRGARALAVAAAVFTLALPVLLACYRAVDPDGRSSLMGVPAAAVVAAGVYL